MRLHSGKCIHGAVLTVNGISMEFSGQLNIDHCDL